MLKNRFYKMKMLAGTTTSLLAVGAVIFLSISYFSNFYFNYIFCIVLANVTVLISSIYCLKNLTERFVMLCFNIMFFLFLLSGISVSLLNGDSLTTYLDCGFTAVKHTCHCLAVSIIIFNVVLYCLMNFSRNRHTRSEKRAENKCNIASIILIIFCVVLVGKLLGSIIQYSFTSVYDYTETYVVTVSKPALINICESIFYLMLCLWLSTKPSKKWFMALIIVTFIAEGFILMSGDRGEPMATLLMVLYYFLWRSKEDAEFYKIRKWHIIIVIISIPLIIYILQFISFSRDHNEMKIEDNLFVDFFSKQGISAAIISRGYDIKGKMSAIGGNMFSVGTVINYLLNNVVSRTILGTERILANSVEAATMGTSYGATMAYILFPNTFLEGVGCGSSYIAELYHDGGWALLCIGNIILAMVMKKISDILRQKKGVFLQGLSLLLFYNIVNIPRNSCFAWLTGTFSIQNLAVIAVLLILQDIVKRQNKNKKI